MSVPLPAAFRQRHLTVGDVAINTVTAGAGPPVLLMHGYPQTHVIWHHVAPMLADDYTVVLTDLRGYGDSAKPASTPDHAAYSKQAMARDQHEVMRALGFDRYAVVGHDRGGRVGHRLALDHPAAVTALAVLDIVPTLHTFRPGGRVDRPRARRGRLGRWPEDRVSHAGAMGVGGVRRADVRRPRGLERLRGLGRGRGAGV